MPHMQRPAIAIQRQKYAYTSKCGPAWRFVVRNRGGITISTHTLLEIKEAHNLSLAPNMVGLNATAFSRYWCRDVYLFSPNLVIRYPPKNDRIRYHLCDACSCGCNAQAMEMASCNGESAL